MYKIKRSEEEIDNTLNSAIAWEEKGQTAVRGMTYEQGVIAAIRWITGEIEDRPIEEDCPE